MRSRYKTSASLAQASSGNGFISCRRPHPSQRQGRRSRLHQVEKLPTHISVSYSRRRVPQRPSQQTPPGQPMLCPSRMLRQRPRSAPFAISRYQNHPHPPHHRNLMNHPLRTKSASHTPIRPHISTVRAKVLPTSRPTDGIPIRGSGWARKDKAFNFRSRRRQRMTNLAWVS
jgi:hypothetical protein